MLLNLIQKYFQWKYDTNKIGDPKVSVGLKVISNENLDLNDPKEFDDPQKFDNQKGISIVSKDLENSKFYDDTSIFDGLVFFGICWSSVIVLH